MSWRYLAAATHAVLQAGAIQRSRFGHEIEVRHKGEIDLVTEVDRACEDAILATLRARFPDHDIVTEETAIERTGSRFLWFIDPLDGTTNFTHGYPFFCASVALAVDGEVVAGAVFDPIKDELFTAERGAGAYLNGRRLAVSRSQELLQSLLVTGFPYDLRTNPHNNFAEFVNFHLRARAVRRAGAAALDCAWVAAGRLDGYWELRAKPWDVGAGALIVREAGGRVTTAAGEADFLGRDSIVASNGKIHEQMLRVLREGERAPRPR